MKKIYTILLFCICVSHHTIAQNIISIESNGTQYQVLDLSKNEKIQWGGYEEIGLPANSKSNGKLNTTAIVVAVGNNTGHEGKPYAAKVCDEINAGGLDDWYLPAKDEATIIFQHIQLLGLEGTSTTLWTSTEASGTTAVTLYCYNGTWYDVQKVDSYNMVCMRKVN